MIDTMPLIGLVGYKGAGKDSVARVLADEYGYITNGFAIALKHEVWVRIGKHVLGGEGWATDFKTWLTYIDKYKYDGPDQPHGWVRPLLQHWGSDFRRIQDPDYWVKRTRLAPRMVVTDARFPNEVKAITDLGGIIWRVDRPGYQGDQHVSETGIKSLPFHLYLKNDGTLDDLAQGVRSLMTHVTRNPLGAVLQLAS